MSRKTIFFHLSFWWAFVLTEFSFWREFVLLGFRSHGLSFWWDFVLPGRNLKGIGDLWEYERTSNASTGNPWCLSWERRNSRWLHREISRLMCCVGDNEGEKWTPRILAQSVRSISGSRGGVIFWECYWTNICVWQVWNCFCLNEYGAQHSGCLKRIPFVDFVFWAEWVGYNLQECKKPPGERKNVCSSTKMPSASGVFAPWPPTGGSTPWTPLRAPPPDPRYRLALPRSPYCGLSPP